MLNNFLISLTDSQKISIIINIAVFLLVVIFSYLLIHKIKFQDKGYKQLFVMYVMFWIPLMLLRSFTGSMQKAIGDDYHLWLVLAAYGFVGIFARVFADWFNFKTKSRKHFIYAAILIQIAAYIPIIIYPSTITNTIQSIGVGIGASCIGTYQLLFNEQYGKSKQFLTVSILSIPPLLADFITSPIQSFVLSFSSKNANGNYDPNVVKYLWVIGLGFVLLCLVMSFFLKENRSLFGTSAQYNKKIEKNNEWWYFVLLCILGSLIMFIKFSNSGSIAQLHLQMLAKQNNTTAGYEGYLSLVFSFGQLIAGLLTGLYLINKIGKLATVSIGMGLWLVYHLIAANITNEYAYLGVHILNGFAYGIVYNLILGFILMRSFKKEQVTPMGVYQSILSIGITASGFFVGWIKKDYLNKNNPYYNDISSQINYIIVGVVIFTYFVFVLTYYLETKNKNLLKQ